MNRPNDTDPAARELARVGRAALPDTADLAPMHLAAIDDALRAMASPASTSAQAMARWSAPVWRTRRFAVAMAAAAFVAVPSMAFAGVLPDSVQHAASQAASAVGVTLPDPASDTAKDAVANTGSGSQADEDANDQGEEHNQDSTGKGLGATTRGTVPGKPEPGEQRGNRYGQVSGGPDQGKATEAHGSHGSGSSSPSTSQRPVAPPGHAAGSTGGSSTPATTPAPSHTGHDATDTGGGGGNAGHGKGH